MAGRIWVVVVEWAGMAAVVLVPAAAQVVAGQIAVVVTLAEMLAGAGVMVVITVGLGAEVVLVLVPVVTGPR